MDKTTQDGRSHWGQDQQEVASGRLDSDDLSRFEGEGGSEALELVAPEPQELVNEPKQKLKLSCHEF